MADAIRRAGVESQAARERSLWRDRWMHAGLLGIILSCVACVTSVSALVLGALGLGLWTGRLEAIAVAVFVASALVVAWRYAKARKPRT